MLFIWGGYLFGNIPLVKNNFGIVTLAIIGVSLLPMLWAILSERRASGPNAASPGASPPP
jgi:membrane-associated protein